MLRALWRAWLVVARKIGQVQSFIILGLVYFVFIAPFGAAVRLCSDPLGLREARSWQWVPPGDEARSSLSAMRLQSWGGGA
jgi:8-oxo-dGTP pyrophosphatase MutT (NUDIX family)